MGFRDFSDTLVRHGWGRAVAKEEAMEILDQNEKDGLVLIGATMQEPQFVCSCCGCGIIEMNKLMPRPVDFAASNYATELNNEACKGCQKCVKRCQMEAIRFDKKAKKTVAIDSKRCIGCGLCVPTCKTSSIKLKTNNAFVPPKDHDALYETIMQHKKGTIGKMAKMTKAMMGMRV
ncbi:MAG: 4Fe-4S dicluster domain-containing protein [Proteobacteria bacterium]|nr:4Fe-4S dicluster domain-containing protein [Pseudomonadota bacterium]